MRTPLILLIVACGAVCLSSGCATVKDRQTVCAEYRGVRCLGATRCSFDRERGCEVCQCEGSYDGRRGRIPSALPPDRRLPDDD